VSRSGSGIKGITRA